MTEGGADAYVTLLLNDGYLPGAVVLAHSLRNAGTTKQLAVMVSLDTVSASSITVLKELYDHVLPVQRILNKNAKNLYLMNRADLVSTFTKINLWRLDQFPKIVYIDADVVALRAPDELFDIEEDFAAAPDVGWPDCFNSGVLVLKPNPGDYYSLLALAERGISFDGADQGLLNMHFPRYHRISFAYNCTPSGHYQYTPAYRHFESSISMLHFIGAEKPWLQGRDASNSATGVYNELLGRWWAVYDKHYRKTSAGVPTQTEPDVRIVQQFVKGEMTEADFVRFSQAKDESQDSAEIKFEDRTFTKQEGRREFSAPFSEWDPLRSAPPSHSRPEASDFPQHQYHMSRDHQPYQSPAGVEFGTPSGDDTQKIFPWETNARKPSRVFAEDLRNPSPAKSTIGSPPSATDGETQADDSTPTTPQGNIASPSGWKAFAAANAWDDMPEIEQFINRLSHQRQGRIQVVQGQGGEGDDEQNAGHRRSVKVTDFPTEVERPSLPVTPAPVRRPSFWSAERDDEGELPAAEGVPKQEDWDPAAKLDELTRHQPDVISFSSREDHSVSSPPSHDIPDRVLPSSAAPLPPPAPNTRAEDTEASH
ncbi:MAG: hypothetical protein M1825_006471 [Sarcosagium campestre]|nr:MAG: hypothetical protein M1825_006471 [Sarcosagium campestre]